MLKYEIMVSALFTFTWFVVKRFPLENKGIANLVKPFIISQVYVALLTFNSSNSSGPINSTLAFELWIWGLGAYNDRPNIDSPTDFETMHYGRYVWVYISAELIGACIAGAFYRVWVNQFQGIYEPDMVERTELTEDE